MSTVPFAKYHGCGNDFILFDNRESTLSRFTKKVPQLCHRKYGIGADGIIFLETSQNADYKMRIFNADGSEAEMCGNGIRCLLKFMQGLGLTHSSYQIETMERCLTVAPKDNLIKVEMGIPTEVAFDQYLTIDGQTYKLHVLNTGVPHAILFVDDIEDIPIEVLAPRIRWHHQYAPKGVNVDFARVTSQGQVQVRTYERGVEGETLACGTGAVATALAAAKQFSLPSPIQVLIRAGTFLEISFKIDLSQSPCSNGGFSQVYMCGPAELVYQGNINIHDFER